MIMPALVYIAQKLVTNNIAELAELYEKIDKLIKAIEDEPIIKSALGFIYTSNEDKTGYAMELVCNYNKRKHYRHYLQMYYGDFQLNKKEIKDIRLRPDLEYSQKFDYINTFIALRSSLKSNDGDYPSCRNIIMLCDLAFSRLHHLLSYKDFHSINDKNISMFGVKEIKHLRLSIRALKITIDDINSYLNEQIEEIDDYTIAYLNAMQCLFSDCISIYDDEHNKDNASCPYTLKIINIINRWRIRIHPSYELNRQLTAIRKLRLVWKIKDNESEYDKKGDNKDEYEIKTADNETVSDHVYACELFAAMFLPESGDELPESDKNIDYDKNKVIAFLHSKEFGPAITGDYPFEFMRPVNANEKKKKIKLEYSSTLLFGNIYGFSCGHSFYDLVKKTEDIHIKLALDIADIQREYKKRMLKNADMLGFDEDREKHFTLDRTDLRTEFGRGLYDTLIKNNPNFIKFE